MISNAVSIGRAPWITKLSFPVQALGCIAMATICDLFGLLHTAPASPWPGIAICHTGGIDWMSGFGHGLSMGLVMMLVSFAPLRWSGVMSLAGCLTALLWILGAGVLQVSILAADQIAPLGGGGVPSAIPRLIILGLTMAAALHVPGPSSARIKRIPFHDGAHCFLRCGPMMIAMMLTGAMSLPWVIAGALLSQLDEAAGNFRFSRLLTCGIGIAATVRMV